MISNPPPTMLLAGFSVRSGFELLVRACGVSTIPISPVHGHRAQSGLQPVEYCEN